MPNSQLHSHPNELRQGIGFHFSHDLASMNLERDFTDVEEGCGLFV